MNRRQRRARRGGRGRSPVPVPGPFAEGPAPSMAGAAIFMAQRSDCGCEVCQLLRQAADDIIDMALNGINEPLEEEVTGGG